MIGRWLEAQHPQHGSVHPCSAADVRTALCDVPGVQVLMLAAPEAEWPLASLNHPQHPALVGWPVAEAHLNRDLEPKAFISPVPSGEWAEADRSEFVARVLPTVSAWLKAELAKSETALFEPLQLVWIWNHGVFTKHEVVMRDRPWP